MFIVVYTLSIAVLGTAPVSLPHTKGLSCENMLLCQGYKCNHDAVLCAAL